MKKIKFIKRQDSGYKLSSGNSGETSLNLSNEIFDFISHGSLKQGEEKDITFRIYKEDFIKAMSFVIMKLPLYKSSANNSFKVENYLDTYDELSSRIETFFGSNKYSDYKVNMFYRNDGRIYLKGLRVNDFSIRDYLVENFSALQFDDEDGILNLRVLSDIEDKGGEESPTKLIVNEKNLTSFILKTIKYFNEKDGLDSIVPYASDSSPIKVYKENAFRLTGMFLNSNIEDVKTRNIGHQRWFEDVFKLGEREVYLSTQWNGQGGYQLTLPDFIELIRTCYGKNYSYKKGPNGEHQLYLTGEILGKLNEKRTLQQIFYGAPGTGKSFEINRLTKDKEVIRTTFHPDSDYSTFVGAYKPTSIDVPVRDVTGKVIVENGEKVKESRIVYEFVEQAFLQAYTKAWLAYANKADGEKAKEQYLVIEEINRGNCAQIFGDLFQLLDRNGYGFSDYPITADKDMKKQLAKAFKDVSINDAERINNIYGKDIVGKVLSGDILLLPDNLYIWATMNTSDQSLFPIDSAFKRRWDWKYIPISEGKENGVSLGWKIKVNGKLFDWWQFVKKVNDEINDQVKSEDKKLGYFFCKAQDGIVSAETFVSKVVFYLWNDVFKDQDVASIFSDGDEELTFSKFYDTDDSGKTIVKEDKVEVLLQNLGVPVSADTEISEEVVGDIEEEMANDIAGNQRKETLISISIPNHPVIRAADSTQFNAFINALKVIGIDRIISVVSSLKYKRLGCPVISTQKYEAIENNDKGYKYCQEEGLYIVKGCKHYTYIRILEDLNSSLNIGLTLETR